MMTRPRVMTSAEDPANDKVAHANVANYDVVNDSG